MSRTIITNSPRLPSPAGRARHAIELSDQGRLDVDLIEAALKASAVGEHDDTTRALAAWRASIVSGKTKCLDVSRRTTVTKILARATARVRKEAATSPTDKPRIDVWMMPRPLLPPGMSESTPRHGSACK